MQQQLYISRFSGEYHWLSNFSPAHVVLDGCVYPTVEHAYQAAKTESASLRTSVLNAKTPGQAKQLGRQLRKRDDWETVKVSVMRELLEQKFCLGSDYARRLVNTGDALLEETNTWGDTFWGICRGQGENMLGVLLTQQREALKRESSGPLAVVVTTINPPTIAVNEWIGRANLAYVVSDLKTPLEAWKNHEAWVTFGPGESPSFAALLPPNHYCRKMLGYIQAKRTGSLFIVDTDDDNQPHADWTNPFVTQKLIQSHLTAPGWVNVHRFFEPEATSWPRGFPLRLVNASLGRIEHEAMPLVSKTKVAVWQGLVDGDPDVDAIHRLTRRPPVFSRPTSHQCVVCGRDTLTPWNSQNTVWRAEWLHLAYLPVTVSFRYTDILRSIVTLVCLRGTGRYVGFHGPSASQERNPHDLMKDFEQEIQMYTGIERAASVLQTDAGVQSSEPGSGDRLIACYRALAEANLVALREVHVVAAWVKEMTAL